MENDGIVQIKVSDWVLRQESLVPPPRRADVDEYAMDGEMLLVDRRSGCTHHMNETAVAIWRHCDGRVSTADIAVRMVEDYEVDLDTAQDDIELVVAALADLDLLDFSAA